MDEGKNVFEEVARVAYELYEKRGGIHGYDVEDWVEAQEIVIERHAKRAESKAEAAKPATTRKKSPEKTKQRIQKPSKKEG